ncbi:MAG: Ribosomal RNA small subunit methyltransferase B [Owenweeksia sp. TMED14]|nr:MAG: Ribosomal RNA small subunit methyltransferase B [Owenweeksia sp. TMED14]
MKRHQNLVNGVLEILHLSFSSTIYADKIIDKSLRANKKWGSRDRAFVAHHSYEIIRWWRLLWFLKGETPILKREKLNELFEVYWDWAIHKSLLIPSDTPVGVFESFPAWLDELGSNQFKKKWPFMANALNKKAHVILRVNTLRASRDEVLLQLAEENVEAQISEITPEAIVLIKRQQLKNLQSFKSGLYEVQDGGSQLISNFLEAVPGDRILDCCAGAGGKALSLASKIKNIGEILCLETEKSKLTELELRAKRSGAKCIRTKLIRGSGYLKTHFEWADKILLDVPCSGTGVIRRDVDVKWKLKPEHLEKTLKLQQEIISSFSPCLKPGGLLVYATCSILEAENELQIREFLKSKGDLFELKHEERISPSNVHSDGYYVAVLKKIK